MPDDAQLYRDFPELEPTTDSRHYSCWKGVSVGIDHETGRVIVVPRACGRWECPQCAAWKSRRYAAMIFAAKPTRHLTLTCVPRLHNSPEDALDTMKANLRKLAYKIRNPKKSTDFGDDPPPRVWEYAVVWEKHQSGWPHAHLAIWGDYVPEWEIRKYWFALTGAFIIRLIALNPDTGHRHNFVKYLSDKTKHPSSNNPRARRVSFSARYHRFKNYSIRQTAASEIDWVYLHVDPDILECWLEQCQGAQREEAAVETATVWKLDPSCLDGDPDYIADQILNWYWSPKRPRDGGHACQASVAAL